MPVYRGETKPPPSAEPGALPPFLLDLLAAVPKHGSGVHDWLFRVARQLHAHRSPPQIEALLTASVEGCGRPVPAREIRHAVQNARAVAWKPTAGPGGVVTAPPAPAWPAVDKTLRARIATTGSLADLRAASPVQCDGDGPTARAVLPILFHGAPLLCLGIDQKQCATAPLPYWLPRLSGMRFVVPSAMTAPTGKNQEGAISSRCLANTGPRWFIVVESDIGTADEQAAVLMHLSDFAPLVLACASGGKSLHGWFHAHADEAVTKRFFRYAVSLGADHATWTRCQLVRLPGGKHANGNLQRIHFWNRSLCEPI
jgi:hypothetical protein